MKYYKILNSIETKEIGHFPQEKTIKWEGMPYEKDSFANQSLFNPVIGKPALPIPEFYKSAKMTSLVSVSNIPLNKYLVVNQKLLDLVDLRPNSVSTFRTFCIQPQLPPMK